MGVINMKKAISLAIILLMGIMSLNFTISKNNFSQKPKISYGYTSYEIKKPSTLLSSQTEIINAINYHITKFDTKFMLQIQDYDSSKIPTQGEALEFYFVKNINYNVVQNDKNAVITFSITYDEAGAIIQNQLLKTPLPNNKKVKKLKTVCDELLKKSEAMNDYEKIVYFHDYIVQNTEYDIGLTPSTAYDVLINHRGESDGYAEAYQLLLTLSGIKNRVIYSGTNRTSGAHYFNKVYLDGEWYNVDVLVDDPSNAKLYQDTVIHTYLLVTDAVSKQRYQWEEKRYPTSNTNNNWYMRNNLVATNQNELEQIVNNAIKNKQTSVSIWIDNYTNSNYKMDFTKNNKSIKKISITTIPRSSKNNKDLSLPVATSLNFEFIY